MEYIDFWVNRDMPWGPIEKVLNKAILLGASDTHVSVGLPVSYTILGDVHKDGEWPVPEIEELTHLSQNVFSNVLYSEFIREKELDTSYVLRGGVNKGRRFRVSVGYSFSSPFFVFRTINDQIPTLAELGVGGEIVEWTKLPSGMILLNGGTGTGKTTMLASMIQHIQQRESKKIVTIEKPVEYLFPDVGSTFITQREVGVDCLSFSNGLVSAMRQAPDIILIGEVRNQEEVDSLIRAAETGHLTLSTTHADSCATTVSRIMSLFDGGEQRRVLGSISECMRGLVSQVLVKNRAGTARTAVREVLTVDEHVSRLILGGDVRGIREYQVERQATLEHSLVDMVVSGTVSLGAARAAARNPVLFDKIVKTRREEVTAAVKIYR